MCFVKLCKLRVLLMTRHLILTCLPPLPSTAAPTISTPCSLIPILTPTTATVQPVLRFRSAVLIAVRLCTAVVVTVQLCDAVPQNTKAQITRQRGSGQVFQARAWGRIWGGLGRGDRVLHSSCGDWGN